MIIVAGAIAIAVVIAGAAIGNALLAHHTSKTRAAPAPTVHSATPAPPPPLLAAESGLLTWSLAAPLSRIAVFPSGTSQLVIAGGLTAQKTTTNSVYTLDTTTGASTLTSHLALPVHDAASAISAGTMEVYGGGSANSTDTTQALAGPQGAASTAKLPQLRSDASAVTVDNTTYIIGGYDGKHADEQVLSTVDGKTFTNFGALPVPVRYSAVTSLGGKIYVFGGITIDGANAGKTIDAVQIIDTATHHITLASWKLPEPLQGSSAAVIDGEMFLVGGQSDTVQADTPGLGTTQVPGLVTTGSDTSRTIWAVDTTKGKFLTAGQLQVAVSNAGIAVLGSTAWVVGGESNGRVVSSVQMIKPDARFGTAGALGAGSPYFGEKLLVADRGNNQVLVMDASMNVTFRYPATGASTKPGQFYYPDDAFFANNGTEIISNQEDNNTLVKISYPAGALTWTYGHPLQAGTAPGFLKAPDDAYQLKNGQVVVADDQNCRVQFINPDGTVASQIGTNRVCTHHPPTGLGSPNGDTPLYNGNILISEIRGSWVSEYTPAGALVWTTHIPISYPSDPQQLGASPTNNPDLYLIADYTNPGAILTFNRAGQVLSMYKPTSGPGMLNHPSLVELLPSGVYMANDDDRDRMVAIDPGTGALVWQYGVSDTPGTAPGMLNKVDGFDILAADGTTPTHGSTG
ncbi:MAG: outer membrane protein assembly factor BamB family protein [Lacisediminihabitans sp.]